MRRESGGLDQVTDSWGLERGWGRRASGWVVSVMVWLVRWTVAVGAVWPRCTQNVPKVDRVGGSRVD